MVMSFALMGRVAPEIIPSPFLSVYRYQNMLIWGTGLVVVALAIEGIRNEDGKKRKGNHYD